MRKPKALVIPFKFKEGYPDYLVDPLINSAVELIVSTNIELTMTQTVVTDMDADKVAKKHNAVDYDVCVLVVPTWFEPVTLIRAAKNFFGLPVIVWGFSNFIHEGERVNLGSSAGAGVAKGTLRELGVFHKYIYYSPCIGKNEEIKKQIWKVANVGRAASMLKDARIVSVGYQFGGMTLGDIDLTKMRSMFGPDLIEMDSYTLINSMNSMDTGRDEYLTAKAEVEALLDNSLGEKLERIVRMYAAIKDIVKEFNAQAITLKCHFALSQELGLSACIPLSVIGNQVVASCEADIPLTLTQLVMHYLSGGELTTYADTHELTGKRVLWGACGFAPAGMCIDGKIICDLPQGESGGLGDTFGDYITNKNHLKGGRMTAARILKESEGGYTLHAVAGNALGDVGKTSEFGAPQYAFTETELDADFDQFAQNLGSHHYALVYADLLEEIEMFCEYKKMNALIERS